MRRLLETDTEELLETLNSVIRYIHRASEGEMKPLLCQCCGGHIDRDTMTCPYCGVQMDGGEDND